jgi:RNA recognition motif-containing protein
VNILARNLPMNLTENGLLKLFLPYGKIVAHNIVMDQITGRSKGFGFVEMPHNNEALAAISALNGKLVLGQRIKVKPSDLTSSPARIRPEKSEPERLVRFEQGGARTIPAHKRPGGELSKRPKHFKAGDVRTSYARNRSERLQSELPEQPGSAGSRTTYEKKRPGGAKSEHPKRFKGTGVRKTDYSAKTVASRNSEKQRPGDVRPDIRRAITASSGGFKKHKPVRKGR